LRRGLRDHAVPVLSTIEEEPMQFNFFSVADHYPEELRTIHEWYAQILDEIELADELGFSAFFLAEHHFHEYGLVPSHPHF
jgi:alkanesulfonate monooxygenase SsuD/methylene tetrahydromethanopterin reductase-like flavin-dependent oxidoreductase (luciferase family)